MNWAPFCCIKGKVGRLEIPKDLNYSELSEGLKAADELPLEIGKDAEDLISQAKGILKFRRAIKNCNGDLDKCYNELVQLTEDPNIVKPSPSPAPGDTPDTKTPPAPPKSPTSPTFNKFAVLQSGKDELSLLVKQVRYMRIVRDIPDILKTVAASKKPGETEFRTIDCMSLELTLKNLGELEDELAELPDLRVLVEAVEAIKKVREHLEEEEWEECRAEVHKAKEVKLVESLPKSCASVVEKG